MITAEIIRELVLPEIERSGGATLAIPTIGNQPPYLVTADTFQPPTWVVGTIPGGAVNYLSTPLGLADQAYRVITDRQWGIVPRFTPSPYTGIGFWLEDGFVYIDGVEFYTVHEMALKVAREHSQKAIYALHTSESEYLTYPAYV